MGEVVVADVPTADELVDLYAAVGWPAYTHDAGVLQRGVAASSFIATVRADGMLVGLLRAVSDGATIAYLQDVLVRPSHQRRGIGRALVDAFLDRYGHVRQRVLLTDDEPDQRAFYEALGFTRADLVDGGPLRAFVDLGRRQPGPGEAPQRGREGHIAQVRRVVGTSLLLVPSVSICLYDDDRRLLLVHHRQTGLWSTPGGAVEPGESVAEACIREAREELGIEVVPEAIAGVFGPFEIVYPNGDRTAYVTTAFACGARHSPRPDDDEIDELRWVDLDEAEQLDVAGWLRPRLGALMAWRPGSPTLFDQPGGRGGPAEADAGDARSA